MSDSICLEWRGPLKIGNLPESKNAVSDLSFCAVYIFFRCYEGGKTLVYVGKTQNFANRLAQHYGDFLSTLVGTLYRDDGSVFRPGGRPEYFRSIQSNKLDETLSYAKADAYRTRFIYAKVNNERLKEVEATIIERLKRNLSNKLYEMWNTGYHTNLVLNNLIVHDYSVLRNDLFTKEEWDQLPKILFGCQM